MRVTTARTYAIRHKNDRAVNYSIVRSIGGYLVVGGRKTPYPHSMAQMNPDCQELRQRISPQFLQVLDKRWSDRLGIYYARIRLAAARHAGHVSIHKWQAQMGWGTS